ncbi:fasciclin-3-like [Arctopsyche grandis]|uniref:fasciclin-3-like n=1 Tax=Arctopsyche grandis TaxID=121162 RepID=UPI00406D7640
MEYFGSGFKIKQGPDRGKGECGLVLNKVKIKHNGELKCIVSSSNDSTIATTGIFSMTVLYPNNSIEFSPPIKDYYEIGDTLQTTCKIKSAQPEIKISWTFDNKTLTDGLALKTTNNISNLMIIERNISRKINSKDHGKTLNCVTSFEDAVMESISTNNAIPNGNLLMIYGIEINKSADIHIKVTPCQNSSVSWFINDKYFNETSMEHERYNFMEEKADIVIWSISPVLAEDFETTFLLNKCQFNYFFKLGATEEPLEDHSLNILKLSGITLSVLVVLIAVFVTVFVKVTNRWCFRDEFGIY